MDHYYGDMVRIRTERGGTIDQQDYEVVEEKVDGKWIERSRYGHMSDDYALTNAGNHARMLATRHIGGH